MLIRTRPELYLFYTFFLQLLITLGHVFAVAPQGMTDTSFTVSKDQLSQLPDWYRRNLDSKKLELFDQSKTTPYAISPPFPDGGAGLATTVEDYLKIARMLINCDENLISKHLIEAIVMAQRMLEFSEDACFHLWFLEICLCRLLARRLLSIPTLKRCS